MPLFDWLGKKLVVFISYLLMLIGLLYLAHKVLWTDRDLGRRDLVRQVLLQVYFTGVQAAGPVIVLGVTVGVFSIVAGVGGIGAISGAENLGQIVARWVLREIAPFLTGVVVIVRSVTAIAAELGGMRVQQEVEALEVMGISPIRHLVTPRLFGGLLSLFGLNILFNAVAVLGGFLAAWLLASVPSSILFRAIVSAVVPADLIALTVKTIVGGMGLFVVACYHGMAVGRSTTEVPIAVSRAALNSVVLLVVVHALVSLTTFLSSNTLSLIGGIL